MDSRILLSPEDNDLAPRLRLRTYQGRTEPVLPGRYKRGRVAYRLIMKRILGVRRLPKGMVVDHINRNPLDIRRENLRLVTPQQNAANRSVSGKGTSKYKGVHRTPSGKWKATISVTVHSRKGKRKYKKATVCLGTFNSEEAAAHAYNETASEWFGEYACLNEIATGD